MKRLDAIPQFSPDAKRKISVFSALFVVEKWLSPQQTTGYSGKRNKETVGFKLNLV
jgi:hypothetical protein